MNICPDLAQDFFDVSAQIVEIYFSIEERAFGIDNECPPQRQSSVFVINAELTAEFARRIRTHGVRGFLKHLFIPMPGKVNELRIGAHRDDLDPQLLELFILLRQSSKLRRSNEGEVSGVEK